MSQPWKRVADGIFPPVFAEMYNPGQDMVDVPPPPVPMIVPPPIGPPAAPPFDELIQQSQWNLQQQEQHLHTLRQVEEKSAATAEGSIGPDLQAAGRLCAASDLFFHPAGAGHSSRRSGYGAADPEAPAGDSVGHHRIRQPAAAHHRHLHQRRYLCQGLASSLRHACHAGATLTSNLSFFRLGRTGCSTTLKHRSTVS